MKSAISIIVLLITVACAACGCGNSDSVASTAAAFDANTAQTLIQLERDWIKAMLNCDHAKLYRILAVNFRYTDPDGNQFTRMQTLDDLKSGALKFDTLEPSELSVQFYQNAAVVFGIFRFKGSYQGQAFDEQVRGTDFFVKQEGRWIAVASQASRLPRE